MIVYLSVLIAIIGLVMYMISTNGKLQEVGRIMLFSGLLAFLLRGEQLFKVLGP